MDHARVDLTEKCPLEQDCPHVFCPASSACEIRFLLQTLEYYCYSYIEPGLDGNNQLF